MHIILAMITAITGLLYAFDRLGIDLGGMNPFYWHRRRKWQKKYLTRAVHQLQRPIEAATVLLVGLVTIEGLVSREQKEALISMLGSEFGKSQDAAAEMFGGSQFLLRDTVDLVREVPLILEPNKELFTDDQKGTLLRMMQEVAGLEGEPTVIQQQIIAAVEQEFASQVKPGQW